MRFMPASGRRFTLTLAIATVVLIGGVGALSFKDLWRLYLIHQVQKRPGFLDVAILASRDSVEWEALRASIRSPEGRTALVGKLIDQVPEIGSIHLGAIGQLKIPSYYWWSFKGKDGEIGGMFSPDPDTLRAAWDLFDDLRGLEMTAPAPHADLSFELELLKDCPLFRGKAAGLVRNAVEYLHAGDSPALVIWRRS